MSNVIEKLNGWSFKKWRAAYLVLFVLQVGFFILFSEKNPNVSYEGKRLFAMMACDRLNIAEEILDVRNPALLAFPTRNNYSARAWFNIPAIRNEYYEWTPDNFLLSPMPELLGKEFDKLVPKTQNDFDVSIFEIRERVSDSILADFRLEYMITNSTFRVDGEISRRKLLYAPPLFPVESADVFPPSVVEVAVNEDGYVVSSTLVVPSGLAAADQQAINCSKRFVFSKSEDQNNSQGLTFGKITFYWFFKPPAETEKK